MWFSDGTGFFSEEIDTRMKFSLTPPPGLSAFDQWKDAMKAVNRLPMGLPPEFRKKVWLSLADHYIRKLKIDWHKTVRLAFNERSNPDDDKLGMQIVKDLHRTGCSSFSGQDNEEDRAVLKRVLLAYARWNKRIGYCQGFNVIAALLLNVMDRKEDDALKVMIYLIDHVLPESYFDNNLRALSVDMAVFRDLLRLTLPTLSRHLDRLQHAAQDVNTGACYEPPLTNVFTMQWFLTLFATCLPKEVVLRVWDAILLEGSEVLLRTALCLWGKLARRIMKVDSADEFYSLMGELSSHMMEGTVFNSDDMIKAIYAIAPFPFLQLTELREKYTYNIRPFSGHSGSGRKASRMAKAVLYSDEDEVDEEEMRALTSFPGMAPVQGGRGKGTDISLVGPGAYGAETESATGSRDSMYMERMSTDITALKMQYDKLRQRQRQAHVIIAGAASAKKAVEVKPKAQAPVLVPKIESPLAMNHLFVGKVQGGRNRLVTHGPRIAANPVPGKSPLTKQLQAVAVAQAASRGKSSPNKQFPTAKASTTSTPPPDQRAEGEEGKQVQACPRKDVDGALKMVNDLLPEQPTKDSRKEACQDASISPAGEESVERGGCDDADPDTDYAVVKDGTSEGELDCQEQTVACIEGDTLCLQLLDDQEPLPHKTVDADKLSSGDSTSCHSLPYEQPKEDSTELKAFSLEPDGDGSFELCQIKPMEEDEGREQDSGIVLSSPSLNGSGESSPVKKPQRPVSIQLWTESPTHANGNIPHPCPKSVGHSDSNRCSERPPVTMGRSNSAPIGSSSGHMTMLSMLAPATTPTHTQRTSLSTPTTTPTPVSPHSPSHPFPLSSPMKIMRPFNPFPVKHVNTNRAKTGLKLGLYTPSTLEHIQGQLLGGLVARKARNASS
ncbi:TBC1 domain family member 30-like isoform X2 [Babylonia areolata]|uniref:TBC1 domain family member 30-like isoform X2 n=1 Tax=Babylonia areolata TaxID=304850 RepID=UPI003FD34E05